MQVTIVDVFAESKYAGNQLAVVEQAGALSDQAMQDIAREMNFSETTFVLSHAGDPANDRARVRIFTPADELPFAGHPTLGTAWVLSGGQHPITLELDAGAVPVWFADDGCAWMAPPAVELRGPYPRESAATLIGLPPEQLVADWPVELARVGPTFVLIPLISLDALRRVRIDLDSYAELVQTTGADGVFLFTADSYGPTADFAARMLFDAGGIRDDPATGSANTAFAMYLRERLGRSGRVVVDQGVEIQRPSRLYLRVQERIEVGGHVIGSVRGTLL